MPLRWQPARCRGCRQVQEQPNPRTAERPSGLQPSRAACIRGPMTDWPRASRHNATSLARALAILDRFEAATPTLSAAQIARRLRARPGSLYPALSILERFGYLERTAPRQAAPSRPEADGQDEHQSLAAGGRAGHGALSRRCRGCRGAARGGDLHRGAGPRPRRRGRDGHQRLVAEGAGEGGPDGEGCAGSGSDRRRRLGRNGGPCRLRPPGPSAGCRLLPAMESS